MSQKAETRRVKAAYLGEAPARDALDITDLALSEGGFEAALFHLGALIRLNEVDCPSSNPWTGHD